MTPDLLQESKFTYVRSAR